MPDLKPNPIMKNLTPEALQQVAAYFQTLAEPTRLRILNFLRQGEHNVGLLALWMPKMPKPDFWICL